MKICTVLGLHWARLFSHLLLCAVLSLSVTACKRFEPVKIGFVDGLTGTAADLGQESRNGAMLAVEKCNADGCVGGRQITLISKDDRHDPETAKRVIHELIDEGVAAIVGHGTSNTAVATAPIADAAKMVMVSHTVTTKELSGKYPHFFRVVSATDKYAIKNAKFRRHILKERRIAMAYDMRNLAYTKSWVDDFREAFLKEGGTLAAVVPLEFSSTFDMEPVAKRLTESNPDGILIVANATHAAILTRAIRARSAAINIGTSEWAATEGLIRKGGKAVEGIYSTQFIDHNSRKTEYLAFRETYLRRFGQEPGFGSVMAYDATNVILTALKKNPDPDVLAKTISSIGSFSGLQAPIRFDTLQDADRPSYITTILDGKFRTYEH